MKWMALLFLPVLAGCEGIPKDQAGTLDRVRAERVVRVGLAAGPDGAPAQPGAFVDRLAARTGARPRTETGSLERLLTRLEESELDLVIGEVETKSPWSKQVTLIDPPLATTQAEPELQLAAIARNGENGWIALLHEEARRVGPPR